MYIFMTQAEGSVELFDCNPALAFILANALVFGSAKLVDEHRYLMSLYKKRQMDILKLLGFPEGETDCKILCKVDVGALTIGNLLKLREALKDRAVRKWFEQLPLITNEIIILTGNPLWRNMLTSTLLLELATYDVPTDFQGVFGWIQDAAHWSSEHPLALGKMSSVQQLMNHWDEIEGLVNAGRKVRRVAGGETISLWRG